MSTVHQQLSDSVALERAKDSQIVSQEVNPMALIHLAMSQNADIDKLTKLMELQERWEANGARKAFYAAMKRFKDNPPKIHKNKHVQFGNTKYDHATLDHACDMIIPALAAVGITHKWIPRQKDGKITVTCVLTHELGFSDPEPPTIEAAPDTTGSKSPAQAIASTITFFERYTLMAAVGMAARDMDTDGKVLPSQGMALDEFDRLATLISESQTVETLQQKYLAAAADAKEAGDKAAVSKFNELKNKRYRELANANR